MVSSKIGWLQTLDKDYLFLPSSARNGLVHLLESLETICPANTSELLLVPACSRLMWIPWTRLGGKQPWPSERKDTVAEKIHASNPYPSKLQRSCCKMYSRASFARPVSGAEEKGRSQLLHSWKKKGIKQRNRLGSSHLEWKDPHLEIIELTHNFSMNASQGKQRGHLALVDFDRMLAPPCWVDEDEEALGPCDTWRSRREDTRL